MSYSYVVTSQRPTAVSHSIVCSFTGPESRNLVLAKGSRLEVFNVTPGVAEGITPLLEFGIFGTVTALGAYRPSNMAHDVLFVLTAKRYFSVLGYDAAKNKITNRATGCVRDR